MLCYECSNSFLHQLSIYILYLNVDNAVWYCKKENKIIWNVRSWICLPTQIINQCLTKYHGLNFQLCRHISYVEFVFGNTECIRFLTLIKNFICLWIEICYFSNEIKIRHSESATAFKHQSLRSASGLERLILIRLLF